MPICPLVFINIKKRWKENCISIFWRGIALSIGMTLLIEVAQAIFHRGTFQLSDLFFNAVGGTIGLLIYLAAR